MSDKDVARKVWGYSQELESKIGKLLIDPTMGSVEGEYKVLIEGYHDELKTTIDRMRLDAMRIYDREESKVKSE